VAELVKRTPAGEVVAGEFDTDLLDRDPQLAGEERPAEVLDP
jgi:hypothetical protein